MAAWTSRETESLLEGPDRLTPQQKLWRRVWITDRLRKESLLPEPFEPYRVHLAWRLIRAYALEECIIQDDEFLLEIPDLPVLPEEEIYPLVQRLLIREDHYGLIGLFDAGRDWWPNRTAILIEEDTFIRKTLQSLINTTYQRTWRRLQKTHRFTRPEIESLIHCARRLSTRRLDGDIEEEKAIMVMRFEEIASRARSALDHRAEIAAQKAASVVLGLGKTEPNDLDRSFQTLVQRVEQKPRLLEDTGTEL